MLEMLENLLTVLIVAECNVNYVKRIAVAGMTMVLIVAECNVNV